MSVYEGLILIVDVLILIGVWIDLYLAWKVLSVKRRESIKRLVNETLRRVTCKN